jgi:hypothetical protein
MPVIIKKNVIYGGGSGDSSKTISYADYLNLPEAEKTMGITYYIPDYPDESSSESITIEKDGYWTVYKYPDGHYIALLSWTTGNEISLSTAYGSLFISTVFSLAVRQNVISVINVSGNSTYLGGGIGGISVSDNRNNIANLEDIKFYIWSATNITARVDASFMCFGEWK